MMNAMRKCLILACVVAGISMPNARADFTFGKPVKYGSSVSGTDDLDCFSSDGLEMYFDPDPAAVQTVEWQQWLIPLSKFIDAGVNMTSVERMCIGVGDLDSPAAGGSGLIYIDDIGFGRSPSSR